MSVRWEDDDRGRGVADAGQLVPGVEQLLAAFKEPDWVAEQPEAHLLPHVEEWCRNDARLALTSASADERESYLLGLRWTGELAGVGLARAAVFSLIGSFAESATYVRQRRIGDDRLRFEVGTGEVAPDARFQPHGHTVVIDVAGLHVPAPGE